MKNSYYDKIKTVRIHKQQFDSINEKADYIVLQCIDDGRVINFERKDWVKCPVVKMLHKNDDFILNLAFEKYRVEDIIELPCTALVTVSGGGTVDREILINTKIIDDKTIKIVPSEDVDTIVIKYYTRYYFRGER